MQSHSLKFQNVDRYASSQNFNPPDCFCDCTGQFVSDLFGNPEDLFSPVVAYFVSAINQNRRCLSVDYPMISTPTSIHFHKMKNIIKFLLPLHELRNTLYVLLRLLIVVEM